MKTKLNAIAFALTLASTGTIAFAGDNNAVTVNQTEVANAVLVEQLTSFGSNVTINQTGNNNSAGNTLNSDSAYYTGVYQAFSTRANVSIYQGGNQNNATSFQEGVIDSNAWINQSGTGNNARVAQARVTSSNGTIMQNGTNNNALTVQYDSTATTTPGENHTTIMQTGDSNWGRSEQVGNGIRAWLNQEGSGNWSNSHQVGQNDMRVDQIGNGNVSHLSQNNPGYGAANLNSVYVLQQGNSNYSAISQNGAANRATVLQR